MKIEPLQLTDWPRIFVGEVPAAFYLELFVRVAFVYAVIMVCMRLMGRRMAAQLSRTELVALVSLAAAIGIPLQAPDRGLLPALVVALLVVLFERIAARRAFASRHWEKALQGAVDSLVADGVVQIGALKKTGMTRERVFAHVRAEGFPQLGRLRRLYLEANGSFSKVLRKEPAPGLSVIPDWDDDFVRRQQRAPGTRVCGFCGLDEKRGSKNSRCRNCSHAEWVPAIL